MAFSKAALMMLRTAQSISRVASSLNSRDPVGSDRWVLTGLRHEILGDGGELLKVFARRVWNGID
jgi:hypothetical protein